MANKDAIEELYKAEFTEPSGNVVTYDTRMYHVKRDNALLLPALHYDSNYVGPIELPKNIKNGYGLFSDCDIKPGCTIIPSEEATLENAAYMFRNCRFPDKFVLNINTRNTTNMTHAFAGAEFGSLFEFGPDFKTENVTDMTAMLEDAKAGISFALPEDFTTKNVIGMDRMFKGFEAPDTFTIPKGFDTHNVLAMSAVFQDFKLPSAFSLPDNFTTQHADYCWDMFDGATTPNGKVIKKDEANVVKIINELKERNPEHNKIARSNTPVFDKLLREKGMMTDNPDPTQTRSVVDDQ